MKNNLRKVTSKAISSIALSNAKKEANSTCLCIAYQPKVPKELKDKE